MTTYSWETRCFAIWRRLPCRDPSCRCMAEDPRLSPTALSRFAGKLTECHAEFTLSPAWPSWASRYVAPADIARIEFEATSLWAWFTGCVTYTRSTLPPHALLSNPSALLHLTISQPEHTPSAEVPGAVRRSDRPRRQKLVFDRCIVWSP